MLACFLKYRFFFSIVLIATIFYSHYYINRATIDIQIHAPAQTYFSVYWASKDEQSYSPHKMARIQITPGTKNYSFFLTDLRYADSLRIDVASMPGNITVKKMILHQPGIAPIQFTTAQDFSELRPFGDVKNSTFSDSGWTVTSTGNHPRFQFLLPQLSRDLNWPTEWGRFLLLLFPALFLLRMLHPLYPNYIYTAYLGFFILGLIIIMAVLSKGYQHPDEKVHITAAQYYENNWLPPPVESPDIRDSYSIYGFSRLNSIEPAYFFAGKFANLLESFHLKDTLALRLFNTTLFAILVLIAIRHISFRLIFLPFLLSPQIWYLFSYMNSDAFSLFITSLCAWQAVVPNSKLNQFLEKKTVPLFNILLLGLLLAGLMLTKQTFYFFTLFLLFYFIWRCIFHPYANFKGMLTRLLLLICIATSVVALRIGTDISINGFNKGEKMLEMQQLTATYPYNLNTPLDKKHIHLQMRERGTSLKSFIKDYRWGEKIFRSGMGTYGYLTIASSQDYYNIMRVLGLGGLLFVGVSIALRGGWSGNLLFGGAIFCCTALIVVACYRAWTVDFQAQGRYLFAIVPILGMILSKTESVYNQAILRTFVAAMFLLSTYSFIGIALLGVAKYG